MRLNGIRKRLDDEEFFGKLTRLVLPITMQMFMLSLVSATDALMLGLVDQTSLSAVSLAGQVQFVFSLTVGAFSGGTGIMAAQYWGKGDRTTVGRVAMSSLRMNLLIGGLVTLAAFFFPAPLMSLLTGDPALITAGADYLRAVALSYVLCGVSQVYLAVLKNSERAKIASTISSAAVVLNIVANAVLIFGLFGAPKLGIVGAAIATVLARAVELIWVLIECRRPGRIHGDPRDLLRLDRKLESDFWRYTGPLLFAGLVWGLAFSMHSVVMGHMGSDAVAAGSIVSIAKSLVSCLAKGLGSSAGIIIGNLLGQSAFDKARRYARRLTWLAFLVGLGSAALLVLLLPIIRRVAVMSDTAQNYLTLMLVVCACNLVAQCINITVLDGIFCAGGDSSFDAITNIFAMWLFSLPLGAIAAFVLHWPVPAVFLVLNLDEIIKLPAVFRRYRKYIWLRNITHD